MSRHRWAASTKPRWPQGDRRGDFRGALERSRTDQRNPCTDEDLRNPPGEGGAECGALSANSGPTASAAAPVDLPPDVADLARRLAALPDAVRASLLAAVKTVHPQG